MSDLNIVYRPTADLKPSPGNPRVHDRKQVKQLERSIGKFGFLVPLLVDAEGRVVAGHGRLAAAIGLGMKEVPTISVAHLTRAQQQAYLIADNKLAENARWDRELLKEQLQELTLVLDDDLTITGFERPELNLLLLDETAPIKEHDVTPADRRSPPVSRLGDVWRIGDQVVACGDSLDPATYAAVLGNETAALVFTDPPFNVPVAGHVGGKGRIVHEEFAMASGEMTPAQFTDFLRQVFQNLARFSADGSLHYICMDWRHLMEALVAGKAAYSELKNLCVWAKTNGGMGNLYRSQHELVFVYKKGTAAHINNVELGRHGRNRTNVWTYAGANAFGKTRDEDLAMHPTVKPVELVADAILDASNPGDIVLDAFGGSGTTLVAAAQTGRRGRGIEIDPYYVDTIVRRLEKATGRKAVLGKGTNSFEFTRAWRQSGLE